MENTKNVTGAQRTPLNIIVLAGYICIDVLAVIGMFAAWSGKYIPEEDSWLIAGVGMLGILIVAINAFMLKNVFPKDTQAIRKLFYEKAFAVIVIILSASSLSASLFRYALTELIGLAGGLGIALVLYRWLIPNALTFLNQKTPPISVLQKLKQYLWSIEMVPVVLFGIPLLIWAVTLIQYGTTSQYQPDMNIVQYGIVQLWFLSTLLLIRSRFHVALDYFAQYYKKQYKNRV